MTLPLITRVFGALERATSSPVADETDFPGRRARRARLQGSAVGRWLFGTADPSVESTEFVAEVDGRSRRVIMHRPIGRSDLPAILNLHGGGWVQGNPEQSAWFASRVAARAGVAVLSFDYRLAPEHPFPAAVEDAEGALAWLATHADDLGLDDSRLAVMGDSAGGALAATTALAARDADGPRIAAEVLIYPGVESYEIYPSERAHAEAPVLTSENIRGFVRHYLGEAYGTTDWRASPLRAPSHEGLPPTLIVIAGHDPLADHGRRYAERLGASGVHVELIEMTDAVHGFISLPGVSPAAQRAVDVTVSFLARTLL